jgi:hypothetical protein
MPGETPRYPFGADGLSELPRVVFRHLGFRVVAIENPKSGEVCGGVIEPPVRFCGEVLDVDLVGGARWSELHGEKASWSIVEILAHWLILAERGREGALLGGPWWPQRSEDRAPKVKLSVSIVGKECSFSIGFGGDHFHALEGAQGEARLLKICDLEMFSRPEHPDALGERSFEPDRLHMASWSPLISLVTNILRHPEEFSYRVNDFTRGGDRPMLAIIEPPPPVSPSLWSPGDAPRASVDKAWDAHALDGLIVSPCAPAQ